MSVYVNSHDPGDSRKVVYTAIFGPYDDLKEPTVITEGWRYICYTDQPLTSSVWEIVQVIPHIESRRMARWYKIMGWKGWEFSMWVDAAFQINVDLNDWWVRTFKMPFSCAKHPLRTCLYREIASCIANNRGEADLLLEQERVYKAEGIEPWNDRIITSGVLMRQNTPTCIELCERWWEEVEKHSTRDQVAFAKASIGYKYHSFVWDYSQSRELKYHKHLHLR